MRGTAKQLKQKESVFAKKWKELLKFVIQQEVDLLSEENKIIKVLAQCKSSPNGPLGPHQCQGALQPL